MASDAVRAQVSAKWQESFARLNRDQPGITGLLNFSRAFAISLSYLHPRDINDPTVVRSANVPHVRAAMSTVNESRMLPYVLDGYLDEVRKRFNLVQKDVEVFMAEYAESSDPDVIRRLVFRLLAWYEAWTPLPDLGPVILSGYSLTFQTLLFSNLPPTFATGFKALCASTLPSAIPPSASTPTPSDYKMWAAFESLGLIDRFESILASVGYEHIEAYVLEMCKGKWSEPMLEGLRNWMSGKVVPWMLLAYARGAKSTEEARNMLQGVGSRFDFHMNKTLCDLRTNEIFDIIIDFPDSMGALVDLRDCLQRVDQRAELVAALRKANQKRLLHPGAETKLILSQYVATIKCLRIVDPPGVLLFKVADPIRRYLRERPDTIRNIVANLVGDDDTGDSLVDENEPIQPLQQADAEDYSDPNWEPEPIDAGPDFRANKPSDILSTLVSIYDSKDLFVRELQVLLAQRLLSITDDNVERVEKERRNIEILKIRFGEVALQVCEVMLRDMTDSKRIDGHVQSQEESVVHPTIISKHFWPALESTNLIMPGQFQKLQEDYATQFTHFKPDKRLRWLPNLGTISLRLELEDRTVEADVPPLEAAFIELFSDKNIWTIDDLTKAVGAVDRAAALNALSTWVDLGVLKEDEEGVFRLLEVAEEKSALTKGGKARGTEANPGAGGDGVLPPVTQQQQQAEQMRIYWKFIEGMLTNLGNLPLDRIQTMLKFAPGYDQTVEQLGAFMEAARREGLVVVREGMWRLNR
ncbi:hypothetical protein BDN72DRAFT_771609 [Pluteus cervinus]|uniref:Uncharacterized protein n=1 Tax=Pluteus cervinus TaxID=181527 RepID=A0ACD3AL86_9AGAR|nr:hypothetical protein BDN72DRAFT_771609 [Pluteus cervinus]